MRPLCATHGTGASPLARKEKMQLEQIASLLAVGALLGGLGKQITLRVFPHGTKGPWKGWRRAFHATMWLHPILIGALIGLSGYLPAPAFLNVEGKIAVGGAVWYALAGMFSSSAFYRLDGIVNGASGPTEAPVLPKDAIPDDGEE